MKKSTLGSVTTMGLLCLVTALMVTVPALAAGPAEPIVWLEEFGGAEWDEATDIVADASGAYVVGWSWTGLPGEVPLGLGDAYVRKYDPAGNIVWTTQFGTDRADKAFSIALYGGYLYVAGLTEGVFPGETMAGIVDAFVAKLDLSGNIVWVRQYGAGEGNDAFALDVDAGGIYVAGATSGTFPGQTAYGMNDAYLRKFDLAGNHLWTRQFGSSGSDQAWGVAVGAEGVYVVGRIEGALPGQTSVGDFDAYIKKFDVNGNEVWTRQFGSNLWDAAWDVAMDSGGVYVAGSTGGALPGRTNLGADDAYLRKYGHAGNELWTRQFGTAGNDTAFAVDVLDGVYVGGEVDGVLPGQSGYGEMDGFVRKYDAAGTEVWTRQTGSAQFEITRSVAVVPGSVYFAGGVYHEYPDVQAFVGWMAIDQAQPPEPPQPPVEPPVVPAMPDPYVSGALVGCVMLLGAYLLKRRQSMRAA